MLENGNKKLNKYVISGINGNVGKLITSYFVDYEIFNNSLKSSSASIFIHLASKSYGHYEEIIKSNIDYLVETIKFCKKCNIKNFIFFSAFSINNKDDFYSKSKLFGEYILRESDLNVLVLRLPMILTTNSQNGILNRIVQKLEKDDEIVLYNYNKKFNNFISVKEICNFIKAYKFRKKFEIVDLGTAKDMTLYEIVEFMKCFLSSKSKIKLKKGDMPLVNIDTDKLINEFKHKPIKTKKSLKNWLESRGKK